MTGQVCWICGVSHPASESCASTSDPRIGTLLEGKYQIVRELGAGGMGKVYEGQNLRIGRRVAIKFLLPEFAAHSEIVRRFENEARAAGGLDHENIAAVHDFGHSDDNACFIVMDFLAGEDCERLLGREGRLPVARVIGIVLQVCRGLDVAHRAGIVHRDLKPANLFLTKRADRSELVKILDFGIAKLRRTDDQVGTATGQAMGTPYYMSPEQARGDKEVDQRTDIYALGVILYELLCGRRPHEGKTYLEIIYSILHNAPEPLESRCPGLPAGLVAVARQAMSVDATQRFGCVAELGEALIPFAGGPVAPFRSQPSARPAIAIQSDQTLASDNTALKGTASTTAPLTPKTPAAFRIHQSKGRTGRRLWLGTVAMLAIGGAVWLQRPHAAQQVPATASILALSAASASNPSALSLPAVQLGRPDGGSPANASNQPSAVPPSQPKRSSGPARSATEPPKMKTNTAAPVAQKATSPAARAPATNAVDISREPNF